MEILMNPGKPSIYGFIFCLSNRVANRRKIKTEEMRMSYADNDL